MDFINLTPHNITLNDNTVIEKSGIIANIHEDVGEMEGLIRIDSLSSVEGIPQPENGKIYIVSMPTLLALRASGDNRQDVVCPITRGEGVVKDQDGRIFSVPGFRTF